MNDYLAKPIIPDRLYAVISGWTDLVQTDGSAGTHTEAGRTVSKTLNDTLSGFDIAGALERMLGNPDLYLELLGEFRRNQSESIPKLRKLIQSAQWVEARQHLHGLKGICGNLGAVHIVQLVNKVDESLEGKETSKTAACMDRLEASLSKSFDAIDQLTTLRPPGYPPSTDPGADPDAVAEVIRQLSDRLTRGRFDAYDLYSKLRTMLPPKNATAQMQYLEDAIRRLDYDEAQKTLKILAKTVNAVL